MTKAGSSGFDIGRIYPASNEWEHDSRFADRRTIREIFILLEQLFGLFVPILVNVLKTPYASGELLNEEFSSSDWHRLCAV